jgi:hypothetical protein
MSEYLLPDLVARRRSGRCGMTAVASSTLAGCHVGSRLRVQEEEGGGSDLADYPRWSGQQGGNRFPRRMWRNRNDVFDSLLHMFPLLLHLLLRRILSFATSAPRLIHVPPPRAALQSGRSSASVTPRCRHFPSCAMFIPRCMLVPVEVAQSLLFNNLVQFSPCYMGWLEAG